MFTWIVHRRYQNTAKLMPNLQHKDRTIWVVCTWEKVPRGRSQLNAIVTASPHNYRGLAKRSQTNLQVSRYSKILSPLIQAARLREIYRLSEEIIPFLIFSRPSRSLLKWSVPQSHEVCYLPWCVRQRTSRSCDGFSNKQSLFRGKIRKLFCFRIKGIQIA